MARKKKGVGFGPRPLTKMVTKPKPKPRQPTFDELCPPYKHEDGSETSIDPETMARAKEIETHASGQPTIKAIIQARRELVDKELADDDKELVERAAQLAVDQAVHGTVYVTADGERVDPASVQPAVNVQARDGEHVITDAKLIHVSAVAEMPDPAKGVYPVCTCPVNAAGEPEPVIPDCPLHGDAATQGGASEGVAPQAHAPDEALELPQDVVWSPEEPGVATTEAEARPAPDEAQRPQERGFARVRVQTKVSDESLEGVKGRILREEHYNVLLTGPTVARKPDGSLLCIYLPGVLKQEMTDLYPLLTTIRLLTDNRGLASGSVRVKAGSTRTRTKPVMSGVMGSMDPVGPMKYCRLTAYTAKNVEKWSELLPLWQAIAAQFQEHVPDRFKVQAEHAQRTPPEWVISGTPFTTITINNSYSTGVHTDSGDLDAGFSTLAVARRGHYTGGVLTFPQFQVGVDMQDGDMILMDAHEWHGNTLMHCACKDDTVVGGSTGATLGDQGDFRKPLTDGPCPDCGAERISVVAYYRTKMSACGTYDDEMAKKAAYGARRLDAEEENAADLAAVSTKE